MAAWTTLAAAFPSFQPHQNWKRNIELKVQTADLNMRKERENSRIPSSSIALCEALIDGQSLTGSIISLSSCAQLMSRCVFVPSSLETTAQWRTDDAGTIFKNKRHGDIYFEASSFNSGAFLASRPPAVILFIMSSFKSYLDRASACLPRVVA